MAYPSGKHCIVHCKNMACPSGKHCIVHCKNMAYPSGKHCIVHCKNMAYPSDKHCIVHCKNMVYLLDKHCIVHRKNMAYLPDNMFSWQNYTEHLDSTFGFLKHMSDLLDNMRRSINTCQLGTRKLCIRRWRRDRSDNLNILYCKHILCFALSND